MLQKEKFNLKFPDKEVDKLIRIGTALDDTFVVDAYFKQSGQGMPTTHIFIHQTAEGKELLQLYNYDTSKKRVCLSFQMMNNREVMIFLKADEEIEIQVINLQSKHISRSFLYRKIFEQKLNQQIEWTLTDDYMFQQTQLVSLVAKDYDHGYTRIFYYKYDQLQEGKAKPVKQYTFQENVEVNKVNNCSKMAVWKPDGLNITFLSFLNQKEELAILRNLRCSWFDTKQNDKVKKGEYYSQMELTECQPDYYFLRIQCWVGYSIVCKYGFLDTSKEDKILKEILIQIEGIPQDRVCFEPLKDTILFYSQFKIYAIKSTSPTYFFDCQQQAMVAADHGQAGVECEHEKFFFPSWERNTTVRAQQKSQPADQIGVTVIKLVSRFSLKDISIHMLLHLNEDFDDDLLQEAIQMLLRYD